MPSDRDTTEAGVRRLALVSEDECEVIGQVIHSLRPHWIARDPKLPFYTLGAASYLDARTGCPGSYEAAAANCNRVLAEHFTLLLDRLRTVLEEVVGAPVMHDPRFALPGFHIFLAHPAFTQPVGDVHYDLQFEHLDWRPWSPIRSAEQLSMTLAIRLPRDGAGLRVWNIDRRMLEGLPPDRRKDHMQRNRKPSVHDYRVGELALHSGYLLHQIEPARDYRKDDERITLQAHAMPTDKGWILYW